MRPNPETVYDQRTALVRDILDKESAARDAKTARLRALRLAKEAQDRTAAPAIPPTSKRRP
jgi:hypothetical protein